MKRDYSTLIWGIVILAVGIVFSGNTLGIWNVDVFFDGWWTLFIIVPGIVSILNNGFNWGAIIVVLVGCVLLLDRRDILEAGVVWKLIVPFVLIAFGVSVIMSFFKKGKGNYNETSHKRRFDKNYDFNTYPVYSTIFGGGEVHNNSENLKGVKVDVTFGGFELDLREARIMEDIVIEVSALFGGVDIYVPSDVEVEVISGTPILGGFSCRKNRNMNGGPKIRVKYTVMFGGIDIK